MSDIDVKPMTMTALVEHALNAIKHDRLEIRPGLSNMLKIMSRIAPNFIAKQLGKPVDRVLARTGNEAAHAHLNQCTCNLL